MKVESTLNEIIKSCFVVQKLNNAYYSEASIQHKLAIEIFKRLKVESILEYKIKGKKEYLDIFFKYRKVRYGIELKYKTRKVESPNFDYTSQSAQNNGKYDFLRDISRIETLLSSDIIDKGYAIFITNDRIYYGPARSRSKVKKFDLIDGLRKNYKPGWKGRSKVIKLSRKYSINWLTNHNLIENNNAVYFSYCIININKQVLPAT